MTPIYGITEAGLKRTGTDARVLPKMALHGFPEPCDNSSFACAMADGSGFGVLPDSINVCDPGAQQSAQSGFTSAGGALELA